MNWSP